MIRTGELGWQSLENGALIDAAFSDRKLALVVLSTNHWPTLRPFAARIATKIEFVQRGRIIRVDVSSL